jgi:hypothetical protein
MSTVNYSEWSNFLNLIARAEDELGNPENIWYRGVTKFDYQLIPSLFRRPTGREKERDLFERYRIIANKVFPDRNSDWEMLIDMQHYNIPTRLLDWTEVLGVAIFFALLGNSSMDSAIYLLDPLKLNRASKRDKILQLDQEKSFEYRSIYWDGRPVVAQLPIAAEAKLLNDRIFVQRGKFTIHGDAIQPLEEQLPACVRKIRLPVNIIPRAKSFLKMAGINEFTVFPDVVGLAPFLLDLVGMK